MGKPQALGIAALRWIVGLVFLVHGSQKLFVFHFAGTAGFFAKAGIPLPGLSAVVVTLVEFLGGISLILGLGSRLAAVLLAIDMLGAIVFVHGKNGFMLQSGGYEYALTLLAADLCLALTGPGAAAFQNLLFGHRDSQTVSRPARPAAA